MCDLRPLVMDVVQTLSRSQIMHLFEDILSRIDLDDQMKIREDALIRKSCTHTFAINGPFCFICGEIDVESKESNSGELP